MLRVFLAALIFLLPLAAPASAQLLAQAKETTTQTPIDPLGRETPRGLMFGYLQAISSGDYERAGSYLTLPPSSDSFRRARGARLAEDLETVLDRAGILADNWTISDKVEGNLSDGLEKNIDRLGKISVDGKDTPLLASRQVLEDGSQVWLISKDTVDAIPDLLSGSSSGLADLILAGSLPDTEVFSVPLRHIIFSAASLAALWISVRAFAALLHFGLARAMRQSRRLTAQLPLLDRIKGPLVILASLNMTLPMLEISGVSVILRGFLSPILDIAGALALAIAAMRMIDHAVSRFSQRERENGRAGSLSILALVRRGLKIVIIFVSALVVLSSIGVDLTAGLAALGIGGLAIALGSQKAIEHFVGSITVVADDIVRIGDYCRFGTTLGTVEDIGIRSTRIRTLSRTVVTIPNGVFSSVEIENFTGRDMFLFKHFIGLAPRTSRKQILFCLEEFRAILANEEAVDPDPARVRLVSLDLAQPKIEIHAYIHAADWNGFLVYQEDLLLRMMDAVDRSGAALAMPTQQNFSQPRASDPAATLPPQDHAAQLPLFDAADLPRSTS